jgi:hypothetical protein
MRAILSVFAALLLGAGASRNRRTCWRRARCGPFDGAFTTPEPGLKPSGVMPAGEDDDE